MKALTLYQPWATFVSSGKKSIETRSWSTRYRGRLLIHAGLRPMRADDGSLDLWQSNGDGSSLTLGAIVASCELTDVVPVSHIDSDWGRTEDRVIDIPMFRGLHLYHSGQKSVVIEDQRPYGDFTPGRYAWLLSDIAPTTERCPRCLGHGTVNEGCWQVCCPVCDGKTVCEPVSAKGRQGLWEW